MDNFNNINNLKNQRFVNTIQPPSNIAVDLLNKFKIKRSDTKFADYNLKEEDPINVEKNLGRPWPPNGIKNIRPTFSETMNDLTQNYYQKYIKTYISLESQLRDTSYYPEPYQFAMYLKKEFNNIVKIRVLNISQKSPNLFRFNRKRTMEWYVYKPSFVPALVSDPDFPVEGEEYFYSAKPDIGEYVYEKFVEELFYAMNQYNVNSEDSLTENALNPGEYNYTNGAYQMTLNNVNYSDLYLIGRYELINFSSAHVLTSYASTNKVILKTETNFFDKWAKNKDLPIIITGLFGVIGGIPLDLINQTIFSTVDYGNKKRNMKYSAALPGFELLIYNDKGEPVNASYTISLSGSDPQVANAQYGRGLPFKINFNENSYLKELGYPISNKYKTVPVDGLEYKFIHSIVDYKLEGDVINTDTITFGLQTIGNEFVPYLIPEPIFFLKLSFPNGGVLENFIVASGYQNSDLQGKKTTSVPAKVVNENEDFSNIFCKCKVNTTPGSFGNIDIINAERIYYSSYVNNVDSILVEFISLNNTILKQLGEVSILLEITEVVPVLKETLINSKSNEIITVGKDLEI